MKEMMQQARAEKEGTLKETAEGIHLTQPQTEKEKQFYEQVQQKAAERYEEKQLGIPHSDEPSLEPSQIEQINSQSNLEGAKEYD